MEDFTPELEYTDEHNWRVHIAKVGGGTIGKSYVGYWQYRVFRPSETRPIAGGGDFSTGLPTTHSEAARLAIEFVREEF